MSEQYVLARVQHYLETRDHCSAVWWAQRLVAERESVDYRILLATCHLRDNQPAKAYGLLRHESTPQARLTLAQAAFEIGKYREAEKTLLSEGQELSDAVQFGAAGLNLLGRIFQKGNQREKAINFYRKSLELDSCLWSSYDALCRMGAANVEDCVFEIPASDTLLEEEALPVLYSLSQPRPTSLSFASPAATETPQHHAAGGGGGGGGGDFRNLLNDSPIDATTTTPLSSLRTPVPTGAPRKLVPQPTPVPTRPARDHRNIRRSERLSFSNVEERSSEHAFVNTAHDRTFKSNVRARRSARLEKKKAFQAENIPSLNTCHISEPEMTKGVVDSDRSVGVGSSLQSTVRCLGEAHRNLYLYHCQEAVDALQKLPDRHFNTSFVLVSVARCFFEMVKYEKCVEMFETARKLEPYSLLGFDTFSTALWHLKRAVRLSYLAQHCVEVGRLCPETWVVVGNCFSLQKEHDTAIKFFQRATQLDESFAYAHTLSAHEYVSNEDFDKAMTGYRHAIRINDRHYNAWYGLGKIYYRQEKYDFAAYHYQRAIRINGRSTVLQCYLGIALSANRHYEEALEALERSCLLDPSNLLSKFQKANVYCCLERYDLALRELEEVKDVAPREASVHYLFGKIHRKLGDIDLAILHFTTCLDLNPKDKNMVKATIDKLYTSMDNGSQSDEDESF